MKRRFLIGLFMGFIACLQAATTLSISDINSWSVSDLKNYVGQEVTFPVPVYVVSAGSNPSVSVHHAYSGTEVALPGSKEYSNQSNANAAASFKLNGVGSRRLGEVVENLTVKVSSTSSVSFISGEWVANSQQQLLAGPNLSLIDKRGKHNVLVCAMNLEYYLVSGFGEGYGPDNQSQHNKQRKKISQALALINADLYGLVEVQKGTAALQEIVDDLKKNTGRPFKLISSPSSIDGTYTQAAFVYCSDVITPAKQTVIVVGGGLDDRRLMMRFKELSSGEMFLFSINHFKAKSHPQYEPSGDDRDKQDGQGYFNGSRVKEANAVATAYDSWCRQFNDYDVLVMGDLNAYSMEDPVQVFINKGMTNLHKYFHNNESYSYRFGNEVGVLDHALASPTLLPQVTGMLAFHINSDEDDCHTYDGWCADETIFRSSDHDPVLVGLRLSDEPFIPTTEAYINNDDFYRNGREIVVYNAKKEDTPSYYAIYTPSGQLVLQGEMDEDEYTITKTPDLPGLYFVSIYANGKVKQFKIIVQ